MAAMNTKLRLEPGDGQPNVPKTFPKVLSGLRHSRRPGTSEKELRGVMLYMIFYQKEMSPFRRA